MKNVFRADADTDRQRDADPEDILHRSSQRRLTPVPAA
jgi:hypothetical protein